MNERCKCGAAQNGSACCCGVLERGVWSHDFRDEAQLMCADNARLCDIVQAADIMLRAIQLLPAGIVVRAGVAGRRLREAADLYKIKRSGQ